jgi:hypothetical protein
LRGSAREISRAVEEHWQVVAFQLTHRDARRAADADDAD